jgi:uncharacterized membrane protein
VNRLQRYLSYFLSGIVGVALVLALLYLVVSSQIVGKKEFSTHLKIGERLGFNVETDWIDFGGARPGDEITKQITIANSFPERVRVNIFIEGPIKPFVYPETDGFLLEPGEMKSIELRAIIPREVILGDYNGTIRVVYFRAYGS